MSYWASRCWENLPLHHLFFLTALHKRLRTAVTALMGETSARVGGIYTCHLLQIPASSSYNMFPSQLAETAPQKMEYLYTKQTFLKSLNVPLMSCILLVVLELYHQLMPTHIDATGSLEHKFNSKLDRPIKKVRFVY